MSDLETRLDDALAALTPARDPRFRVEILLRREQAAFRRALLAGIASALGLAVLTALALAILAPTAGSGPLWTALIAGAAAGLMAVLARGRAALGGMALKLRSKLGRIPGSRLWC